MLLLVYRSRRKMNKQFPYRLIYGLCAGEPDFDSIKQTGLGPSLVKLKHLLTVLSSYVFRFTPWACLLQIATVKAQRKRPNSPRLAFCSIVPSQCQTLGK